MSGLTKDEKARIHQLVLSEANGHEFTLWIFISRMFVACKNCGVLRNNESSARFQQPCKGPISVELQEQTP